MGTNNMRFFLQFLLWTCVGSLYAVALAGTRFWVYWSACGGPAVLGGLGASRSPRAIRPVAAWCNPPPAFLDVGVLVLSTVLAVFFAIFTAAMAYDQVEGMTTNTTAIESMKGWEEEDRSIGEGLADYCGAPMGLAWLVPAPLPPSSPAYFGGAVADPDEYEPRDPLVQRHFRRIEAQIAATAKSAAAGEAVTQTVVGAQQHQRRPQQQGGSSHSQQQQPQPQQHQPQKPRGRQGAPTAPAAAPRPALASGPSRSDGGGRAPVSSLPSATLAPATAIHATAAVLEAAAAAPLRDRALTASSSSSSSKGGNGSSSISGGGKQGGKGHVLIAGGLGSGGAGGYGIEDVAGVVEVMPGCVRPPHADAATAAAIAAAEEAAGEVVALEPEEEEAEEGSEAEEAAEAPVSSVEEAGEGVEQPLLGGDSSNGAGDGDNVGNGETGDRDGGAGGDSAVTDSPAAGGARRRKPRRD